MGVCVCVCFCVCVDLCVDGRCVCVGVLVGVKHTFDVRSVKPSSSSSFPTPSACGSRGSMVGVLVEPPEMQVSSLSGH